MQIGFGSSVFGSGIVTTGSDFGRAGAMPTHPELDWLALEFSNPSRAEGTPVHERIY